MRVSQFEVYRLCQRSLEALGAPYGVDRDGADAVVWLEARGLPGLALLAADLPVLEAARAFAGLAVEAGAAGLDAAGRSAVAFVGGAIDYLRLLSGASQDRRGRLILDGCRSPLFLLPAAVAASGSEQRIGIAWTGVTVEAGTGRLSIRTQPGLDPAEALCQPGPARVELSLDRDSGTGARPPLPPSLTQDDLEEAFVHSLDRGIAVDDGLWQRLAAVAARVQVPASEVSRRKGAGGGDANA